MNYRVLLFVIAAFATVFCTAVNAYTLRIAYPLWQWVAPADFSAVHQNYLRLLGPVITFPHIVMFFASAGLLRWRPEWFSLQEAIWLFALDAAVVAVSAFWAGPIHSGFERTGVLDAAGLYGLLVISALRTVMMLGPVRWLGLRFIELWVRFGDELPGNLLIAGWKSRYT